MDHTFLAANYTMPAFTPQPQSTTALWLVLILGTLNSREWKTQEWKLWHHNAGVEIAGVEFSAPNIRAGKRGRFQSPPHFTVPQMVEG